MRETKTHHIVVVVGDVDKYMLPRSISHRDVIRQQAEQGLAAKMHELPKLAFAERWVQDGDPEIHEVRGGDPYNATLTMTYTFKTVYNPLHRRQRRKESRRRWAAFSR